MSLCLRMTLRNRSSGERRDSSGKQCVSVLYIALLLRQVKFIVDQCSVYICVCYIGLCTGLASVVLQ